MRRIARNVGTDIWNFVWAPPRLSLGLEPSLPEQLPLAAPEPGGTDLVWEGSVMNGLFLVCFPTGDKREKNTGYRCEIWFSLEIIGRKREVKEWGAFENTLAWLVYCVCFWKTFAYVLELSEMAGLDGDPHLAWLLAQLEVYWKQNIRGSRDVGPSAVAADHAVCYHMMGRDNTSLAFPIGFFNFQLLLHFLHAHVGIDVGKFLSRAWQPWITAGFLMKPSPRFEEEDNVLSMRL